MTLSCLSKPDSPELLPSWLNCACHDLPCGCRAEQKQTAARSRGAGLLESYQRQLQSIDGGTNRKHVCII